MSEELLNEIDKMVKVIFRSRKTGYFWIAAKFGNTNFQAMSKRKVYEIHDCLLAKKENRECYVHGRIHHCPNRVLKLLEHETI